MGPFCVLNSEGEFIRASSALCEVVGNSAQRLIGEKIWNYVDSTSRLNLKKIISELLKKKKSHSFELQFLVKHDSLQKVKCYITLDQQSGHIFLYAQNLINYDFSNTIKDAMLDIRGKYIRYSDRADIFFNYLLHKMLELASAEYGFIAEVKNDASEKEYLPFSVSTIDLLTEQEESKVIVSFLNDFLKNQKELLCQIASTRQCSFFPIERISSYYNYDQNEILKNKTVIGAPIYYDDRPVAIFVTIRDSSQIDYSIEEFCLPLLDVVGEIIFSHVSKRSLYLTEVFNAFYKMALDKSAIVAFTDNKGRITYVNEMFCRISKYSESELIGKDHRILNSGTHPKIFFETLWRTISSGNTWQGEICNKAKDGEYYWVDTTIVPYKNAMGEIEKYIAIRKDITAQKEQQLKLDKALKDANSSAMAKSYFLSTMSHEIRTPLNGIIAMTGILARTKLNQEQKEFLETISRSGSILLSIINDILDFSKIDSGKMDLEEVKFDAYQFIKDIVVPHQYGCKNKAVEFKFDVEKFDYFLIGDSGRMGQIINNVLSNAVKFTDSGYVEIKVRFVHEDSNVLLLIEISDSGIGISDEYKDKIFSEFSQADSSIGRKFGGTGLGLSICKKLSEIMGGDISLTSTKEDGTTFYIKIPFHKGELIPSGQNQDLTPESWENITFEGKVLVAEDNSINQMVISRILDGWNVDHLIVANGKEVIDILKENSFDLILMDCQMPEMDGLEATQIIRRTNKLNNAIPIVALTANAIKSEKEKCFEVGMNDYLSKPINLNKLQVILSKFLVQRNIEDVGKLGTHSQRGEVANLELDEIDTELIDKAAILKLDQISKNDSFDFVLKLIDKFIDTSAERIEELQQYLKEKNYAEIAKICHSVKSMALFLGAKKLGNILNAIENDEKNNAYEKIDSAVSLLEECRLASGQELLLIKEKITKRNLMSKEVYEKKLEKILYTEDDINVQNIANFSFVKYGGFNLRCCSNGAQTLELLQNYRPDLILLDSQLPDMDGIDLFHKIKAHDFLRDIPIVFLTAQNNEDELQKISKVNPVAILKKPFDPVQICKDLNEIWKKFNRPF